MKNGPVLPGRSLVCLPDTMKVTGPMIERALAAYHSTRYVEPEPAALIERILRAALNDPAECRAIDGQTTLAVVDGKTVIVGG